MLSGKQQFEFKRKTSLEQRERECYKMKQKFDKCVPVIVEKHQRSQLEGLKESKLLLNEELQLYHLQLIIRKKLKLRKTDGLYLFVDGSDLLKTDLSMREVYERYMDEDGFLYINYYEQSSYGGWVESD